MLVPKFLNDRKSLSENALAPTQRHNMSDTASIYHHTTHERYIHTNKTNMDSAECRQAGEAREWIARFESQLCPRVKRGPDAALMPAVRLVPPHNTGQ